MDTMCRSPCRERGLKCAMWKVVRGTKTSLPVQGAWIEIEAEIEYCQNDVSRSPCRERGLKCFPTFPVWWLHRRSPCRERGLKSRLKCHLLHRFVSLPVQGAWIEIAIAKSNSGTGVGRSPCRERGLKCASCISTPIWHSSLPVQGAWIEIVPGNSACASALVAPRAGSVD